MENKDNMQATLEVDETILGTKSIRSLMIQYCTPAIIAMLVTGVQAMIDGLYVGNILGPESMASVNLAIPFVQVIIGLTMIISIGGQSHIGIKFGMGKIKEGQDAFRTFLVIIIAGTILIAIIGYYFSYDIAGILGADDILRVSTAKYIQITALFACPIALLFYFGFLNRLIGKPELYFKGSLVGLLGNIILNYLFIVKLGLGIAGAALATVGAYSMGLLVVVGPILSNKYNIGIKKGDFNTTCIKPVLCNGASEGVNSISIATIAYLFNMALMKEAGANGVAAFTAVNYIGMLGTMVLFGISDGIGPIASYNYGHDRHDRVKKVLSIAHVITFIIGAALFVLLFFFGGPITSMFLNGDTDLIEMAASGGRLYSLAFFLMGYNIVNSGFFTFIGKGLESVIVAASRGVVFVSIGIVVLPMFLGINGVWLCVAFAEFMAAIIGVVLLKRLKLNIKTNNI